MVKQWGFVHIPLGSGKPRRAELLVGYPLASGFQGPAAPAPPRLNIFRKDVTGPGDVFRRSTSGRGQLFRG